MFYKTQRDLAIVMNSIIDEYWANMITEEDMISMVSRIYINNPKKILKENDFTKIVQQQCGKRRLEVIEKVLTMNGMIKDIIPIDVKAGS